MRVGHLNYYVLGATVGAVALLAVGVHAATTMVTIQVTNDPTIQQDPAVRGGLVAYTDYDATASNGDVYVYNLDDGTRVRVVTNAASQSLEDIDGSIVVYSDDRNSSTSLDVYSVDLATMIEQAIVVAPGYQTEPVISGSRVAWEHSDPFTDPGNVDIYVGCTTGCTPTQITSAPQVQFRPAISGDLLVWEDARSGNPDIFAHWFSAPPAPYVVGENPVATSGALSRNPDVSGTRVVWDQQTSGLAQKDIFLFDFATGLTQQITTDPANQVRPRISGNLIVWEDHRNAATGGIDLYGYDLNTNTEIAFVAGGQTEHLQDVDVRADGGFDIAYTVDQGGGNSDIFVLRALITANPTPTPSATPTAEPTPTPTAEPTPTPPPTSGDPCDPASGAPEYFAETFERNTGSPHREERNFSAAAGPGTMCLTLEHVSSAWVDFNDDDVFGPSDFNPNATTARADITLLADNELGVKLAGKPCDDDDCDEGDDDHDGDGDDDGDDDCDDDDDDDWCRTKPGHGGGGHHGVGHHGGGHHGDDDDDDDGDHGECAQMTVRIVGAIPAPSMSALIEANGNPETGAAFHSADAEPSPGRGCSVALGTSSPLPGFLLLGSLVLATRRRSRRLSARA